jgi:hypothetical protein
MSRRLRAVHWPHPIPWTWKQELKLILRQVGGSALFLIIGLVIAMGYIYMITPKKHHTQRRIEWKAPKN